MPFHNTAALSHRTYHSSAALAPEQITAASSVSASPAPMAVKKAHHQHALLPAKAVKAAARHAYAHLLGHASLSSKRHPEGGAERKRAKLECFTRASSEQAIHRPSASDLAMGVVRLGHGWHVEVAGPAERPHSHGPWRPC